MAPQLPPALSDDVEIGCRRANGRLGTPPAKMFNLGLGAEQLCDLGGVASLELSGAPFCFDEAVQVGGGSATSRGRLRNHSD